MANRNLFIDLGHFSAVSGAAGEIEWTRKIAARLEEQIDKSYWNVLWVPPEQQKIPFINVKDSETNLTLRFKWIRDRAKDGDQLISIHGNAAAPSARGVETFYAAGKGSTSENNRLEAIKLSAIYNKYTGVPIRGTGAKPDNQSQHSSLGMLQSTIPNALLLEAGFVSNKEDMAVDPYVAAKAIADYVNSLNPNYKPMPVPQVPEDQELRGYLDEFKAKGILKSTLGMDNPAKRSETVLIVGRAMKVLRDEFEARLRDIKN